MSLQHLSEEDQTHIVIQNMKVNLKIQILVTLERMQFQMSLISMTPGETHQIMPVIVKVRKSQPLPVHFQMMEGLINNQSILYSTISFCYYFQYA